MKQIKAFLMTIASALVACSALAGQVLDVRLEADVEGERIEVRVSAPSSVNVFLLSDPLRLVADFQPMKMGRGVSTAGLSSGLVARVRHGERDTRTLRLVFDLDEAVTFETGFHDLDEGAFYRFELRSLTGRRERAPVDVNPADTEPPQPEASPTVPDVIPVPDDKPDQARRREAAEAAAKALIEQQMDRLDGGRARTRPQEPLEAPDFSPGGAWRDPLPPPWQDEAASSVPENAP